MPTLLFWWQNNQLAVLSLICGFFSWGFPSLLFYLRIKHLSKPRPHKGGELLFKDFFVAETLKFLSSTGLIALFVKLLPLKPILFLAGFVSAIVIVQIAGRFLLPNLKIQK